MATAQRPPTPPQSPPYRPVVQAIFSFPCEDTPTTILVENLGPEVDPNLVNNLFTPYGPIKMMKVLWIRDSDSIAIIEYESESCALKASFEMNGQVVADHVIRVSFTERPTATATSRSSSGSEEVPKEMVATSSSEVKVNANCFANFNDNDTPSSSRHSFHSRAGYGGQIFGGRGHGIRYFSNVHQNPMSLHKLQPTSPWQHTGLFALSPSFAFAPPVPTMNPYGAVGETRNAQGKWSDSRGNKGKGK